MSRRSAAPPHRRREAPQEAPEPAARSIWCPRKHLPPPEAPARGDRPTTRPRSNWSEQQTRLAEPDLGLSPLRFVAVAGYHSVLTPRPGRLREICRSDSGLSRRARGFEWVDTTQGQRLNRQSRVFSTRSVTHPQHLSFARSTVPSDRRRPGRFMALSNVCVGSGSAVFWSTPTTAYRRRQWPTALPQIWSPRRNPTAIRSNSPWCFEESRGRNPASIPPAARPHDREAQASRDDSQRHQRQHRARHHSTERLFAISERH